MSAVGGPPGVVVAHLSDLHFGTETPAHVAGVLAALEAVQPDLVVVSGDLTQRARRRQFAAARRFLDALTAPWLAVPGNHDVPLWDVLRRVLSPLGRYRRFITPQTAPLVVLPGLRVLGLDSTRRKVVGRLLPERLEPISRLLDGDPADLRVLVTHHPLVRRPLLGSEAALAAAARARVDVVLAGHFHHVHATEGDVLALEAGSPTSQREPRQSFNVLRAERDWLSVETWTWDGHAFAAGAPRRFPRRDHSPIRQ